MHKFDARLIVAAAVLAPLSSALAQPGCPGEAPRFSMAVLPHPWPADGFDAGNRAMAINNHGDVVGQSAPGGFLYEHALGTARIVTGDGLYGSGSVYTVNDSRWMGGIYRICCGGGWTPALFGPNGELVELLDESDYEVGYVSGSNAQGDFVGYKWFRSLFFAGPAYWPYDGFLRELVTSCAPCTSCIESQEVFDINDNRRVAGITHTCPDPGVLRAYFRDLSLWEVTHIEPLPGDTTNTATSLNNAGDVVGHSGSNQDFPTAHAYIRTADGAVTPLGSLPGLPDHSYAWSINESRVVVGSTTLGATGRGWRWSADTGMVDLNTLLEKPSEWTIVEARGVNDSGQIAATIRRASDGKLRAALLSPLVCPADWNCDHTLNSADFFDFLNAFFTTGADFNTDGATDSRDFFGFLAAFFDGCP